MKQVLVLLAFSQILQLPAFGDTNLCPSHSEDIQATSPVDVVSGALQALACDNWDKYLSAWQLDPNNLKRRTFQIGDIYDATRKDLITALPAYNTSQADSLAMPFAVGKAKEMVKMAKELPDIKQVAILKGYLVPTFMKNAKGKLDKAHPLESYKVLCVAAAQAEDTNLDCRIVTTLTESTRK